MTNDEIGRTLGLDGRWHWVRTDTQEEQWWCEPMGELSRLQLVHGKKFATVDIAVELLDILDDFPAWLGTMISDCREIVSGLQP